MSVNQEAIAVAGLGVNMPTARYMIASGEHPVPSFMVAEAVKIIVRTLRGINTTLMNQSAIFLDKLGIDIAGPIQQAGHDARRH